TKIASSGELLLYDVDETVMIVPLNRRLKTGDSLVLEMEFYVNIPKEFPGFGYWFEHYEMTQWYPKMCVFDEEGWHYNQLHPLEGAYGEFATYDVIIDIPDDYVVAGTGRQIDPLETQFLDTLIATDKKMPRGERKTVHFHAENVHDFAWVCSKDLGLRQYNILNSNINIYYRLGNEKNVEKTYLYALDVIARFTQWFGAYPYGDLNFVDGFHQGKATYPQMIITGLNEDGLTRLFETDLTMKIGKQWFNGAIGSDGMRDAWLGEGYATYAAIRYMEDKYGKDNTLIKVPFLPPLSLRYFHRFFYYVVQTNRLEKPVSTPAHEYVDVPLSHQNSTNSKPGLFLFSVEKIVGTEIFDKIIQHYYQTYTFEHARPYYFIKICEEISGRDLAELFDSFLNTTEFCDWRVSSVTANTVKVENTGELNIPADLHVITESGEQVYSLGAGDKQHIVVVHDTLGEIERVAIDPAEYTLDPNYWNNYAPRKVSIKPIFDFDWPSFSMYQILWMPYLWYDSYDGITTGFYIFGDNFADVDFVRGGYQVTAGYTYGFESGRHYPSLNYQTPVLFEDGKRVRIRFSGSRSRGGDNVSIGISSNLGRPFTRQPQM
ncbi:MAG: M1 family metallopeptidase, partial [bacterium]